MKSTLFVYAFMTVCVLEWCLSPSGLSSFVQVSLSGTQCISRDILIKKKKGGRGDVHGVTDGECGVSGKGRGETDALKIDHYLYMYVLCAALLALGLVSLWRAQWKDVSFTGKVIQWPASGESQLGSEADISERWLKSLTWPVLQHIQLGHCLHPRSEESHLHTTWLYIWHTALNVTSNIHT